MRATLAISTVVVASSLAALTAQSGQQPVFRSGVELLEVDVSVVDNSGKPVSDLRAPEFAVTVDGKIRRVVNSEFISDVSAETQTAGLTIDPFVSNNTDRHPGRLIVIVIDQNNMTMERVRSAIDPI